MQNTRYIGSMYQCKTFYNLSKLRYYLMSDSVMLLIFLKAFSVSEKLVLPTPLNS